MTKHEGIPPDVAISPRVQVRRGDLVLYRGKAARVEGIESSRKIMLAILGTRTVVWGRAGELSKYRDERVSQSPDRGTVVLPSDVDLAQAERWIEHFESHGEKGWLAPSEQTSIAMAMYVSERTVKRHFERFCGDPSVAAQLRMKPGPQVGTTKLAASVEAVITQCIDEKYESEERFSVQATSAEVERRCKHLGLSVKPPSYTTIRARLLQRPRWPAERKRHGRVRGDATSGPAGPPTKTYKALEFVEIDHAIVDLIVVDSKTREELGRPWITLAIDVGTRTILGFHLTFYAPSQTSVALALEHCCCPKDEWLEEIGYEGEWRPYGLMKEVGWDNAKCFKSTPLRTALRLQNIKVRYRKVKTPTHGAHIERYIGTYMGKIHLLKGTTFSNTKDREDYNSQKKSVISLDELVLWTAHEINGVYHNTVHKGLGCTPLDAWDRDWIDSNGRCVIPPFPEDRREFRLAIMPGCYRVIGREGIQRFGLKYWDDFLTPLIRDRKRYWIAHDPRNISVVYLRYDKRFIDIPWRDRRRRPIALFELEDSKRALRELNTDARSEAAIFQHMEEKIRIEENAEKLTRTQRRNVTRRPVDDRLKMTPAESNVDYQQHSAGSIDPKEFMTKE